MAAERETGFGKAGVGATGAASEGSAKPSYDPAEEAIAQLRAGMDQFVNQIDLKQVNQKVLDFGREKPLGLAAIAFGVGLVVGLLSRR